MSGRTDKAPGHYRTGPLRDAAAVCVLKMCIGRSFRFWRNKGRSMVDLKRSFGIGIWLMLWVKFMIVNRLITLSFAFERE